MSENIAKTLRLETLERLAERLGKNACDRCVLTAAREFFEGQRRGSIDSDTPYRIADITPANDDVYEQVNDAYSDGFDRGFAAGIAAMEEFVLFCNEKQKEGEQQ